MAEIVRHSAEMQSQAGGETESFVPLSLFENEETQCTEQKQSERRDLSIAPQK